MRAKLLAADVVLWCDYKNLLLIWHLSADEGFTPSLEVCAPRCQAKIENEFSVGEKAEMRPLWRING